MTLALKQRQAHSKWKNRQRGSSRRCRKPQSHRPAGGRLLGSPFGIRPVHPHHGAVTASAGAASASGSGRKRRRQIEAVSDFLSVQLS